MSLFQRRDIESYTDSLAAYLPGGELFISKSIQDSNFRKLLRGLAWELFRANGYLREYDILPDETEKFLSEWESTLGIPDDCFSGTGDLNERRRDILVKLAALGVQTAEDFVELAAIFGVTVEVVCGALNGNFTYTFPMRFYNSAIEARFTIVVRFVVQESNRFTLTFPFPFGDSSIGILECLFRKIKPANCDIIFEQI
jgi:uncharacterized protein YmfQ (DUF2313 family)